MLVMLCVILDVRRCMIVNGMYLFFATSLYDRTVEFARFVFCFAMNLLAKKLIREEVAARKSELATSGEQIFARISD